MRLRIREFQVGDHVAFKGKKYVEIVEVVGPGLFKGRFADSEESPHLISWGGNLDRPVTVRRP